MMSSIFTTGFCENSFIILLNPFLFTKKLNNVVKINISDRAPTGIVSLKYLDTWNAKKENNKELIKFCAEILTVFEKNNINGHIEWEK